MKPTNLAGMIAQLEQESDMDYFNTMLAYSRMMPRVKPQREYQPVVKYQDRNALCKCGSGRKAKKCCRTI